MRLGLAFAQRLQGLPGAQMTMLGPLGAALPGGGGGGRPTFAQGSGKDAAKLDDALARARALVESALKA
mgnify:CR=1 FL=1